MSGRTVSRLAWGLWALALTALLCGAVLGFLAGVADIQTVFYVLLPLFVLAFSTVGALVASRHARNPIGWIFLVVSVLWSLSALAGGIADFGAGEDLTASPVVRVADWLGTWIFVPGLYIPVTFLFLLFPNGRLPSRRWRTFLWISLVGVVGAAASGALAPGPLEDAVFLRANPFAIGSPGFWDVVEPVAWFAATVGMLASVAALIVRFRRSEGEERQQIKTLMSAAILVAVVFVASGFAFGLAGEDQLATSIVEASILFALLLVPVAAGIAILKYRLYDIDVVINKALVYGALAVLITLVYVAIVVGVGWLAGAVGNPALSAVAAAVIALAFQPARRRVQRFANRLVYGKRATPYEVLSEFADRLSDSYSVDDVLPRMTRLVAEGTGASDVRVWLRVGGELRQTAAWPTDAPALEPAQELPALPGRAFEVLHQGIPFGAITVVMPPSEPMSPEQERLVTDVASQAGLVLRNVSLIEDLKASRKRLVAAQDEERRKIERNIHDGTQQQLVALAVKQRLAASLVGADDERARAMLGELQTDTTDVLEDLRDLARGIYPPLLADKGLVTALEAQARRSPVPATVEAEDVGRFDQDLEAAVYFCVLEALQNVAKYAEATRATVRLSNGAGEFAFEVTDNGAGFDPTATAYGTGLQGMTDRLAAMGGELEVRSAPGEGTAVTGRIPAPEVGR